MRNTIISAALATAFAVAPMAAPTAAANTRFFAGTAFHVGGTAISIVLGGTPRAPHHYWRTSTPLRYRGVHCSDACFFDHGSWYHAQSCPVVGRHFRHFHRDQAREFARWAPHPRSWGRYDRDHHRYDRHDRYDRYDRNDRRGRGGNDRHWSERRGSHHRHDHRTHQGRACPYDR